MDLAKEYIIQCLLVAANNLRLTTSKIEVIVLLKEHFVGCKDIADEINILKTSTYFSKLAIKLSQIYFYINNYKIDFLKISEKFKGHVNLIINDLNQFLEVVTPATFQKTISELGKGEIKVEFVKRMTRTDYLDNIKITGDEESDMIINNESKPETEKIKEKLILDDDSHQVNLIQQYQTNILKPLKPIDAFLKRILIGNYTINELDEFLYVLIQNNDLSKRIGFEIVTNMHEILIKAFELIKDRKFIPSYYTIEEMRSCLIVIAAVVKNKNYDITTYLNRAEHFGKRILLTS
ncbi:MAG: hypothetical protein JXA68_10980 [Ignavibacteriales bacterium]|nr:hypothetical protein [Ignavibacteriales bacterium]